MANFLTKQKTKKIPKLRFAGFLGEWEDKKLGKVCGFTQGVQIPQSEQIRKMKDGYTRYLYIRDFFTNKFPCYVKDIYPNKIIKSTEIMVVNTGNTAGKIFMGATGVLSNNCFKIGFNIKEIDNKFLFMYLGCDKIQNKIQSFFNAGGQPHLGHSNIALVPFIYPVIEEQQKIAGFLGAVDEWTSNLRAQKEALGDYKKGMMQKIFSQEIRFKNGDVKYFTEWEEKKLGEVFSAEKGSGLPKDVVTVGGKNECILYGELYTKYKEVIFYISSKTNSNGGLRSEVGDLLIPCSTTTTGIDLANITALNKECVLLGGDITVLRSKENIDNIFYAYYLSNYKKIKIASYAQGSTIVHLYYNHFKKMKIGIPVFKEQQKIAEFLTSIDNLIESKQQQITRAELWKKGLMQQLFV